MQIIIGLMGPSGCGKDTLANYHLQKGASGKITHAKFLKELCSKVFNIPLDVFYNEELKDKPFLKPVVVSIEKAKAIATAVRSKIPESLVPLSKFNPKKIGLQNYEGIEFTTPRAMMQFVGTDMIKNWYGQAHAYLTYQGVKNRNGVWFITDLRFIDEYELAKDTFFAFYPIKIIGRNEEEAKNDHRSEKEFNSIEAFATISNNSTLEQFFEESEKVFKLVQEDAAEKYKNKPPTPVEPGKSKFTFTTGETPRVIRDMDQF